MRRMLLYVLILCSGLFAAKTSAQSTTGVYTEEQGDNIVFRVQHKTNPGSETIFLKLENLKNCNTPARTTVHEIRSDGETLLILRPVDVSMGIGFKYSYTIFPGRIDPKVDTTFVYRMPCSALRPVKVYSGFDVYDYLEKENNQKQLGVYFYMQKGDTVYAVRRGVVTEIKREEWPNPDVSNVRFTSLSTSVNVEHADGSCARYNCLDAGNVLVREGDTLLPGTPLALVGSYDGEAHHASLLFYWYTANPNKAAREKESYVSRLFFPPFATTDGAVVLVSACWYLPVVDSELILREMTKKEQKRWRDNKKRDVAFYL